MRMNTLVWNTNSIRNATISKDSCWWIFVVLFPLTLLNVQRSVILFGILLKKTKQANKQKKPHSYKEAQWLMPSRSDLERLSTVMFSYFLVVETCIS